MKKIFQEKREFNYLYFSFFLTFLTILSFCHYWSWDRPSLGVSLFFILYAIGQAFLEVCFFVFVAHILKRWAPKWSYYLFISASFVLLLLHFTNFTMVRLMDATVSYIFKFCFGSGFNHLIVLFQALNLNMSMIAIIFATLALIPAAGLGFYWLTQKLTRLKPLQISLNQIVSALIIAGVSLFLLDLFAHPYMVQPVYHKFQKTLPLGATFIPPAANHLALSQPFAPQREEKEIKIPNITLSHRPNIYLFVIEALRRDYIHEKTAPHLVKFGEENIQFRGSFSNAISTHLSWFSIFHSDLPFYWAGMRDTWKKGSVPLQFLKKLGYKIHVRSAADLRYFNMDKLLFGAHQELLDSLEEYPADKNPAERDALAIESMKTPLEKEGQVYIVFLDSTHSEYYFPKDFPLVFEPIAKEIDYLTISPKSPELELIKNRYRNSIHYVDHLFGQFFSALKNQNLYDDAIIAITADHGEEFFEEGALFHGTHLNQWQTSVPIYLKFPSKEWIPQTEVATHLDLLPSILHYLTKQSDFSSLFDGQSIFSLERWPFRIAVSQNGPDTPIEFTLEQTETKLHARFVDPTTIDIIELQGFLKPDIFAPLLN